MKYYSLIGLLLLAGCDRKQQPVAAVTVPGLSVVSPPAPSSKPLKMIIMGQSNAEFFSPDGVQGMNSVLPVNAQNCAHGGSWIDQWEPSGAYYQSCINMIGQTPPDVMFWYQGEADATSINLPGNPTAEWATWGQEFTAVISDFKRRYPNTKIVFAQLATIDPAVRANLVDHWQDVKNQQASIYISGVEMVKTEDLAILPAPDGVHLTAHSEYLLGQRVAAMLKIWGDK